MVIPFIPLQCCHNDTMSEPRRGGGATDYKFMVQMIHFFFVTFFLEPKMRAGTNNFVFQSFCRIIIKWKFTNLLHPQKYFKVVPQSERLIMDTASHDELD